MSGIKESGLCFVVCERFWQHALNNLCVVAGLPLAITYPVSLYFLFFHRWEKPLFGVASATPYMAIAAFVVIILLAAIRRLLMRRGIHAVPASETIRNP